MKAEMLSKDEGALFNIANNFTIRYLNEQQKGDYDSAIWHQWMFYVNLSTIHVITRLVNRKGSALTTPAGPRGATPPRHACLDIDHVTRTC